MDTPKDGPFGLVSHRLGALPILNHFLDRIGLDAALERWLPEPDRRFKLAPATAIRLLVVNLLVGRAPLYGLGEWAALYAPHLLGRPGGDYRDADGRSRRGKPTAAVTFGHSKDHRRDLLTELRRVFPQTSHEVVCQAASW